MHFQTAEEALEVLLWATPNLLRDLAQGTEMLLATPQSLGWGYSPAAHGGMGHCWGRSPMLWLPSPAGRQRDGQH